MGHPVTYGCPTGATHYGRVGHLPQTSVRVSARAAEHLAGIAGVRGVSRDQAIRDLIDEYVIAQRARSAEDRLTHISTVLQFPPRTVDGAADGRVRLAPRLDEAVVREARELALRLPGQARHRAYRGYSSRPLGDALVTAIASVSPFVDEGLEGLPPLLSHQQALGLWRLTVAASLTVAERKALTDPASNTVAVVLRVENVAWHSSWRFDLMRRIARQLLTGPAAAEALLMLSTQETTSGNSEFELLRHDLECDPHHELGMGPVELGLQGRGRSAVWRAHRVVALEGLARWLTTSDETVMTIDPPVWELKMPAAWHGHRYRHGDLVPAQLQADLAAGRVLRVDHGSRYVLWPYTAAGRPVEGFDAVLRGVPDLAPVDLAELVLLRHQETRIFPQVPAALACQLGFITPTTRDQITQAQEQQNAAVVQRALRQAQRRPADTLNALRAAVDDHEEFMRVARRARIRCRLYQPCWQWQVRSVKQALKQGHSVDRLTWLAAEMQRIRTFLLERAMEQAARLAPWSADDGGLPML